MNRKKILFISGTRADFGKIKSLLHKLKNSKFFDYFIFVTGMHLMKKYGYTVNEIKKSGLNNLYLFRNNSEINKLSMDEILAKTITGLSTYVKSSKPDMIVVHGDRLEALAGAIVGSFNNIFVSHIEGGEISGTLDEILRHSISKLSHYHFVSNNEAKKRLIQLGENKENVFIIGSPDFDIMNSKNLPSLNQAFNTYDINFTEYFIFMYHPVTSEIKKLNIYIKKICKALIKSKENFIVIYPNNDPGSDVILEQIKKIKKNERFKIFPSLQFEYFLTLLKNSKGIIGNSSAGVREAPYYGIRTINIGTRQQNRNSSITIKNVDEDEKLIIKEITKSHNKMIKKSNFFGDGKSSSKFLKIITKEKFWMKSVQKQFNTIIF